MSGLGHHERRFGHVLPMSALPADALADTHHRLRQGIKLGSGQSGRQYPFLRYDRAAKTTLGHPRRFGRTLIISGLPRQPTFGQALDLSLRAKSKPMRCGGSAMASRCGALVRPNESSPTFSLLSNLCFIVMRLSCRPLLVMRKGPAA